MTRAVALVIWALLVAPLGLEALAQPLPPSRPRPAAYLGTNGSFAAPGGMLGLEGSVPSFNAPFNPGPVTETDLDLLQSCGNVGINDFSGQLFNMPEVFQRFQNEDVYSDLARQLITYNYSMPQTAALFGQLSTFGNERFRQFQAACSLTAQQNEARRQYMDQCVARVTPGIEEASLRPAPAAGGNAAVTPEELSARRRARAFEICQSMYTAESRQILDQSTRRYAETQRQAQDVNALLRPLLCPRAGAGEACWTNLFLPQVRLCGPGMGPQNDCNPDGFGIRQPSMTAITFLDLARTSLAVSFVSKTLDPFRRSLKAQGIDEVMIGDASVNAVRTLARSAPSQTQIFPEFQRAFLNCPSSDLVRPLSAMREALLIQLNAAVRRDQNNPNAGESPMTLTPEIILNPFTNQDYDNVFTFSFVPPAERNALAQIMEIAAGCAANQHVPFLDPILFTKMRSCTAEEQDAFYTVAAFDTAMHATKSTVRYVQHQLREAAARLKAGDAGALQVRGSLVSPSQIVFDRVSTIIETIMLPTLRDQLAQLEDIERSRGALSARVRMIYNNEQGCLGLGR